MPRIRRPIDDGRFRPWKPNIVRRLIPIVREQPSTWDWRNVEGHNWVDPIRDQGNCGSCVAFAATAAVEAHRRIEVSRAGLNLDLSEAFLFFTAERQCNQGDPRSGWHIAGALDMLMDQGICHEENYPYTPVNQNANLVDGGRDTFRISGYDSTANTAQMKRWLFEEGPLVTRFDVFQDFNTF